MRQAKKYYKTELAGFLTETDDGEYVFQYENNYVQNYKNQFLTFTMPVRQEAYRDNRLFPFFEGLIPEGWCWILPVKTGN